MTFRTLIDNIRYRGALWATGFFLLVAMILTTIYAQYISLEPNQFNVQKRALITAKKTTTRALPTGYVYSNTLSVLADTILEKNGGYLSNDIAPPSVFLDNMPSWEFGALVMIRDGATALRNQFARSISPSS